MRRIYINPQQLNINTILKKHNPDIKNEKFKNYKTNKTNKSNKGNKGNINLNSDITIINNILNNNNASQNIKKSNPINNNKYNIVKYLGEGIQGSLYLANDTAKQRYICKKISLDTNNAEQVNQIELELNILKYLSSNKVTKEHINPCLEYKIIDNNIFTIFPVFNGYSLNHLYKYLIKIDNNSYYKIVFHLIKTILHGLAKIHQSKIAHQNINVNSILVSTYTDPKEIFVKFTDFGLGCGNSNMDMGNMKTMKTMKNMINIEDYEGEYNKTLFKFNSCKVNNFTPVNIDENIISELVDDDYLGISQKYDLLCLGCIFLKLLLFFENLDIDFKKGYNKSFMKNILQLIDNKYLSKVKSGEKIDYKKLFPFLNVNDSVKCNIIEYIKLFKEYILCKTSKRKTCQYVLDKLIIYEKYKDEVF